MPDSNQVIGHGTPIMDDVSVVYGNDNNRYLRFNHEADVEFFLKGLGLIPEQINNIIFHNVNGFMNAILIPR